MTGPLGLIKWPEIGIPKKLGKGPKKHNKAQNGLKRPKKAWKYIQNGLKNGRKSQKKPKYLQNTRDLWTRDLLTRDLWTRDLWND